MTPERFRAHVAAVTLQVQMSGLEPTVETIYQNLARLDRWYADRGPQVRFALRFVYDFIEGESRPVPVSPVAPSAPRRRFVEDEDAIEPLVARVAEDSYVVPPPAWGDAPGDGLLRFTVESTSEDGQPAAAALNEVLKGVYADRVREVLNSPSPIASFLGGRRGGKSALQREADRILSGSQP